MPAIGRRRDRRLRCPAAKTKSTCNSITRNRGWSVRSRTRPRCSPVCAHEGASPGISTSSRYNPDILRAAGIGRQARLEKGRFRLDVRGGEPMRIVVDFHDQGLADALPPWPHSQLQHIAVDDFRAVEGQPSVDAALDFQPASGGPGTGCGSSRGPALSCCQSCRKTVPGHLFLLLPGRRIRSIRQSGLRPFPAAG